MSIIHSMKNQLLDANEEKEDTLIRFLNEDIKAENTFVYMSNSTDGTELVISSGEIKVYKSVSITNKIITVEFIEPIKPYGKVKPCLTFSTDLKVDGNDIIVFPSTHSIRDLFSEFISYNDSDEKEELKKREHKLIFNPVLAKFLISEGFRVIDIKKDKNNPENWIPIFLVDTGFKEAIKKFNRLENFRGEE